MYILSWITHTGSESSVCGECSSIISLAHILEKSSIKYKISNGSSYMEPLNGFHNWLRSDAIR